MNKRLMAASLVALGLFAGHGFATTAQDAVDRVAPRDGLLQVAQNAAVPAVLSEVVDLKTMKTKDIVARQRKLAEIVRNKELSRDVRQSARAKLQESRAELQKRKAERAGKKPEGGGKKPGGNAVQPAQDNDDGDAAGDNQQPPAKAPAETKEEGGNGTQGSDAGAEQQAKNYLNTASETSSLSELNLRRRVNGMRTLLGNKNLSPASQKELRVLLQKERQILRSLINKRKQNTGTPENQEGGVTTAPPPKGEPKLTENTPPDQVLQDRRRPDDLRDEELRIRIRIWLDFQNSDRYKSYNDIQRREWLEHVNRDREFLRRRLEQRRNIRRVQLERPSNINIVIGNNDRYDDSGPSDVLAAEVQDDDIERVLVAPPRREVKRRVTLQEYENDPQYRRALTRIDVDTIRFGFNEAFVREEEVDNLDRIAWVIERVLAKYPNEIFLIEGHTDAVGDGGYNQKLSRARAEAVKKALSTYYVIPGRNLRTVGMGERYLKIPTAEAEQENRRVSISRATAVISGFAD